MSDIVHLLLNVRVVAGHSDKPCVFKSVDDQGNGSVDVVAARKFG